MKPAEYTLLIQPGVDPVTEQLAAVKAEKLSKLFTKAFTLTVIDSKPIPKATIYNRSGELLYEGTSSELSSFVYLAQKLS